MTSGGSSVMAAPLGIAGMAITTLTSLALACLRSPGGAYP